MFGLEILDIGLGLIFLYLILALTCTAVNELIAGLLNLRGRKLLLGVNTLFHALPPASPASPERNRDLGSDDIYRHPLVRSLYRRQRWPSYIPSPLFARAVLDTLFPADSSTARTMENIRVQVNQLRNESLRRTLLLLIASSGDSLEQLQKNIEEWFNQVMERVSGWYKRQAQWITLVLALILAIATNADTIGIANRLSTDAVLREALVAQAMVIAERPPALTPAAPDTSGAGGAAGEDPAIQAAAARVGASIQDLERLGLALGWKPGQFPATLDAVKVLGLLLTALAVSLGAPFWFDILNKVMAVRATGAAPSAPSKSKATT